MIPNFPAPGPAAPAIDFHAEAGGSPPPPEQFPALRAWIETVVSDRQAKLGELNFIFCGDAYLHRLNVEYLDHDTLTDVITFPAAPPPTVAGDVFISTERVAENARDLKLPYAEELRRVMIHGVLHLTGQGDKSEAEARQMRQYEARALALFSSAI